MKSIRFNLNKDEVKSFLKGLAISIGGAALAYIGTALAGANLSPEWAWVIILAQNGVNFLRLWLQGVQGGSKKASKRS